LTVSSDSEVTGEAAAVPEPGTFILLPAAGLCLIRYRRRMRG
jgi:hypothetical protein